MSDNIHLSVSGMTCAHCQKVVKEALEAVPGVSAAEVNLTAGTARVHGNSDPAALMAAVEEEGYTAALK